MTDAGGREHRNREQSGQYLFAAIHLQTLEQLR
jgi:hypothetical protein